MDLHSNNKYVWILSVQNFTSYRIKIISILAHIQDISQDFATASQEDTTENEGKTSHSPFHIRGVICPQDDLLLRIWALENSLLATSTPQGQTISPSKCTGTICQHMLTRRLHRMCCAFCLLLLEWRQIATVPQDKVPEKSEQNHDNTEYS